MVTVLKKGASKSSIRNLLSRLHKRAGKGINVYKYVGKISLNTDAVLIQKKLRDEWE